ncbi:TAXI family TRAP transporter solute-binding subunit [Stella sp.]|uniref:TAXI family TRAP transporter solute-binding subunit n=1 Tax=Stella sp. TaxID=2912054 RepID=UPI0035B2234A
MPTASDRAAERRLSRRALLAATAAVAAAGPAAAESEAPLVLTLGTATEGGGFAVYGAALAGALAASDPGLRLELRATPGSGANLPMLETGALDLGLVQGTSAYEALAGIGRPATAARIVGAMYSSPGMFVVRADRPFRRIADLRGQRVVLGAASSGLVVQARYVLDGLGLDPDRDFDPVLLEKAGDGPPMVLDGRAAALWGGGVGWPGFARVAAVPAGARFIGLDAGETARVQARHPFLKPMTVAAGAYPGIGEPLGTVGAWNVVMARPDLPEAAAWRYARALHRAEAELGRRLAQARETTLANTLAAAPAPRFLHAGTARYLRETGLLG